MDSFQESLEIWNETDHAGNVRNIGFKGTATHMRYFARSTSIQGKKVKKNNTEKLSTPPL